MQTHQPITREIANPTNTQTNVPRAIATICILGAGGYLLSVIGLLVSWQLFAAVGAFFLLFYIAALGAGFLSIIWLWQMKKKGAYLNAALFVISQIILMAYGVWSLTFTFIISLIVTGIALYYSKDME